MTATLTDKRDADRHGQEEFQRKTFPRCLRLATPVQIREQIVHHLVYDSIFHRGHWEHIGVPIAVAEVGTSRYSTASILGCGWRVSTESFYL